MFSINGNGSKCIVQYLDSKKTGNKIPCPLCKKETQLLNVDQLPTNFDKVNLLGIYRFHTGFGKENERNRKLNHCKKQMSICDSCERISKITNYCADCELWMCETCTKAHKKIQITSTHTIKAGKDMHNALKESFTEKMNEIEDRKQSYSERNECLNDVSKEVDKLCKNMKANLLLNLSDIYKAIENEKLDLLKKINVYEQTMKKKVREEIKTLGNILLLIKLYQSVCLRVCLTSYYFRYVVPNKVHWLTIFSIYRLYSRDFLKIMSDLNVNFNATTC